MLDRAHRRACQAEISWCTTWTQWQSLELRTEHLCKGSAVNWLPQAELVANSTPPEYTLTEHNWLMMHCGDHLPTPSLPTESALPYHRAWCSLFGSHNSHLTDFSCCKPLWRPKYQPCKLTSPHSGTHRHRQQQLKPSTPTHTPCMCSAQVKNVCDKLVFLEKQLR